MNSKNEKNIILSVTGSNKEECIEKIVEKYGSNYVLQGYENKLSPGFFGIGQRKYVEQKFYIPYTNETLNNTNFTAPRPVNTNGVAYDNESFMRNKNEFIKQIDPSIQLTAFSKQLSQISKQVNSLVSSSNAPVEHKTVVKIVELLEENGFTKTYIQTIKSMINNEFTVSQLDDYKAVQNKVLEWIGEGISIKKSNFANKPKVIIIVGPTGVGKTTTIAKMAAKIAIEAKKNSQVITKPKIRMITTDIIRVGAQEQLENWAEIIGVKVDKAETSEHLEILYGNYVNDSDFIFIDTAGFSPNDIDNFAAMRRIFSVRNMNESMFLAVTAGTSAKDLDNIIRNFEQFNFKSIIVTKCDETTSFGSIISVLTEKQKSVSFITTGQDVLNTIHPANPIYFLKKLDGFELDMESLENKFGKLDS